MTTVLTNPARIQRREAILRLLDAREPNMAYTDECAHAARCTPGEAIVELLWLQRAGHVMPSPRTTHAYGMRWGLVPR